MIVLAIIVSGVLYYLRDYIQALYMNAVAAVWLLGLAACVFAYIGSRFTTLEIRDKDLLFKRGVFAVKTVLVPYNRITDTRYVQSLVERVLGLGTLEVETASESGVAIRIGGVRDADVRDIMGNVSSKTEAK